MQINPSMQGQDIYFVSKFSNLNDLASASELNDKVSKVNMSNIEIARDNPQLESNQKNKEKELISIAQLGTQRFTSIMQARYEDSMKKD